ncbi:hypothetical protein HW932_21345 [Allochromatium humboldtianum]|uniref:Uncharacterized protein n=1 Tax=Allochromatium humboldtianum TaxID=504901 RepID=A0A850RL12_9GAMM|nr:hypothetical protein [Allochromatium humboldtianum]NVZ11792.1 hypothetical protein [Allochromatium humboldtianum]
MPIGCNGIDVCLFRVYPNIHAAAAGGQCPNLFELLKLGVLSDAQIAQVTGLSGEQVRALREADQH